MAAPHAPDPAHGNPDEPGKVRSTGSVFDFLLALFSESRPWVRAVVVLGVFGGAGFGVYRWISPQPPVLKEQALPQPAYPFDKGKQVDVPGKSANNDPRNVAATQRISDEDEHFKWHATHEKHEPDWNLISMADDNNLLEYKYYKDTDRCILLLRKQNGDANAQWIRESVFGGSSARSTVSKYQSKLSDLFVETASASPPEAPPGTEGHLQPVQAGCANPHPGAFSWWWGPPTDQCWSPYYRRFADGCTHHQMFNRCYNSWDANVYWDYCTGGMQHY